ncbi:MULTISPECIES: HNH endonuclease [Bradyrhizobium]|uniref:HNH endonuclease n=1 Tax=Bradyrhizobium TaxID=374 RepID=UPI0018F41506|nr:MULTISPECIES: HNH endonuclease [Bradyrhizobium]
MALELYRRHQGNPPGKGSMEIVELSKLLNKMGAQLSTGREDFRNPNGVYMKAMNFRRFDLAYKAEGKKGLERDGRLEGDIWTAFAGNEVLLSLTASSIRANVDAGLPIGPAPEAEETFEAEEGRVLTRVHLSRERNRKLVEQKKLAAIKGAGKLACEVCSFDFEAAYGEHGAGFIEAHHLKPVHTLLPGHKTKLDDLALLCSNCHRMVHARRPWLTVQQLKERLVKL